MGRSDKDVKREKTEEELANPTPSNLITPARLERFETLRLAAAIVWTALHDQPTVALKMSTSEKSAIRRKIRNATTEELQRRIEAVGENTPSLLQRSMLRCGYNVVETPEGMRIELEEDGLGAGGVVGQPIDYDLFMKKLENGEDF